MGKFLRGWFYGKDKKRQFFVNEEIPIWKKPG